MVGKGRPVSFGNGSAVVAAASSSPQQTVIKQIVTKSPHSHSEEIKSDSNSSSSLTGTPKQSAVVTEAQQPLSNAMRLRRQEEPEKRVCPNAGASPLLDDDDENDDLNESLQQMDSLLTSLHSKEARLNWMLEAVSTAYEKLLGVVKTNVTNLWFAGDGSAKHALGRAESAREPASRLGFVRRDDT